MNTGDVRLLEAWEQTALNELAIVIQGLATQGYDSPGELINCLRGIADLIDEMYNGSEARTLGNQILTALTGHNYGQRTIQSNYLSSGQRYPNDQNDHNSGETVHLDQPTPDCIETPGEYRGQRDACKGDGGESNGDRLQVSPGSPRTYTSGMEYRI